LIKQIEKLNSTGIKKLEGIEVKNKQEILLKIKKRKTVTFRDFEDKKRNSVAAMFSNLVKKTNQEQMQNKANFESTQNKVNPNDTKNDTIIKTPVKEKSFQFTNLVKKTNQEQNYSTKTVENKNKINLNAINEEMMSVPKTKDEKVMNKI